MLNDCLVIVQNAVYNLSIRIFRCLCHGVYLFHLDTQKAQTSVDYSLTEAFALPDKSNKQQETYAGMKTHYTDTGAAWI